MATGSVLHLNAVGMLAGLEEVFDPSLRDRPFVIANARAPRAVVLDLSPRAHREGLRRGMTLSTARGALPGLELREPRPELYAEVEDRLFRLAATYTPLVERAGRGHLFADLAGTGRLHGAPADAACRLRSEIREATGLLPSIALASNKTASKVASRVFRPGGFVALAHDEESDLIRRQPVGLLPGVGTVLLGRFSLLEIEDIGNLAELSFEEGRALGPRGADLVARARGLDASPVDPEPLAARFVEGERLFEPDTADPFLLRARLASLVAELAFGLRREGLGARQVGVELVFTDGGQGSGSLRGQRLRVRDDEVLEAALLALERARSRRVRVRRLRLRLSALDSGGPELDLFEPEETRKARLQTALDRIRGRYGLEAIETGALLAAEGA